MLSSACSQAARVLRWFSRDVTFRSASQTLKGKTKPRAGRRCLVGEGLKSVDQNQKGENGMNCIEFAMMNHRPKQELDTHEYLDSMLCRHKLANLIGSANKGA